MPHFPNFKKWMNTSPPSVAECSSALATANITLSEIQVAFIKPTRFEWAGGANRHNKPISEIRKGDLICFMLFALALLLDLKYLWL